MRKTPLILMAAAMPFAAQAADVDFKFGGFVKLDAMVSTYSEGDVDGALFYVPSTIPVESATGEETTDFDMNAQTSRFNLTSVTTLDNGEKIKAFFEMDFNGGGGNELVSNSYNPRLRHAFFSYNNLLVGQTWTTFMNTGALPESVDFLGVSESTVFSRQAQIRYTMGDFQFALENPSSRIDMAGTNSLTDDASFPDVVVRYNMKAGSADMTVAGLFREISYDDGAGTDDSTTGYGVNFSGKVMVGADDLKFSYTYGSVGRYVGLAMVEDAVIDSDGDLDAPVTSAGFVSFRHHWSPKMRSSITYSMLDADYDDEAAAAAYTKSSSSLRVNLMYSPVKPVTYGVEYTAATRELVGGAEGDLNRVHFTAKYAF
ncbi:MAG: porin [Oceanospirillaceae bacterium]|uniref:DcaP family trimeric outer membrane transporter n=1 Tax=unclassified Thalassolituus TaxID=2624967 RepID=UPI000C698601|nr:MULTISPECIES: DcaP family trimeric outer membrane transporter [unclassified Thalassolituus]MAS24100.1 porin [Oceanospirillaceae bacterium]MAY00271.1 porin [Oceanospirillaceae bacterium]MBL35155.1 porin [Oceanospirillaceae bacterium]MBS51355.1 porin [Oceanospirillaceae bacterium]